MEMCGCVDTFSHVYLLAGQVIVPAEAREDVGDAPLSLEHPGITASHFAYFLEQSSSKAGLFGTQRHP